MARSTPTKPGAKRPAAKPRRASTPKRRPAAGETPTEGGKPSPRVTDHFLAALAADFEAHGATAIATARGENPGNYLRLVAALLPKEPPPPQSPIDDLSDEELATAIATLRALIADTERS